MLTRIINAFVILAVLVSCKEQSENLPYLGPHDVVGIDTIYYKIPPFSFVNQHGNEISNETIEGKVVVADFFFTHCPTICPKMTAQMKRLSETTSDLDYLILSHSIDPANDTVERLKWYAENNGIKADNWHFLTGDQAKINQHGTLGYMISAVQDDSEPGGFAHSSFFILLDKQQHIRGYYDGTSTEEVDRLILDLEWLCNER